MEWIKIQDKQPEDGQRVLVFNSYSSESCIRVFNEAYMCWDTEDGDDFDCELERCPYWMPLPDNPKDL